MIEDPTVDVKCRFGYRDVKKTHKIHLLNTCMSYCVQMNMLA